MPRGQKRSSTERMTLLQTKIDSHKSHIEKLENQKSVIQKEMHNETLNELASLIEKKNLTVSDVKKLINRSTTPKSATKSTTRSTARTPRVSRTPAKTIVSSNHNEIRPNA